MNILVNWLNSCDQFFWSSQQKDGEEKRDEQWYLQSIYVCHAVSIILWISISDPEKKRDTQRRGMRVTQISMSQLTSAINCSDRYSRREKERHAAEKNVATWREGVARFSDIHMSVNSCGHLFWSEKQKGEGKGWAVRKKAWRHLYL